MKIVSASASRAMKSGLAREKMLSRAKILARVQRNGESALIRLRDRSDHSRLLLKTSTQPREERRKKKSGDKSGAKRNAKNAGNHGISDEWQ